MKGKTGRSDETNDSELKCGCCCGSKNRSAKHAVAPQDAAAETVAVPGLQTETSMVPSVSSEKLSALETQVGFPLFFCDFQSENAEIAPFFVNFNKK